MNNTIASPIINITSALASMKMIIARILIIGPINLKKTGFFFLFLNELTDEIR